MQPDGADDRFRFEHILIAARDAINMTQGFTRSRLDTDFILKRALVNAIQEIGEAAAKISLEGRARIPELPWGQIVRTRNILVHVYWGIDMDEIWGVVQSDLPALIQSVESALQRWDSAPDTNKSTD